MRLATFRTASGEVRAGEVRGTRIVAFDDGSTVLDRLRSGDRTPAAGRAADLAKVRLVAPHPPPMIYGIGRNYADHAAELGNALPTAPMVFLMPPTAANGPCGPVRRPDATRALDYEVELAAVFGRTPDGGIGIVGWSVANDVSARDLQSGDGQWARGKGADGFCPFGPWVTTVETLPDPAGLRLRTWVDGELRQDATTDDLVFGVPALEAHLRTAITPQAGDLLLTGTPSGVGHGFVPPRYLEPGAVVRMEIDGLGTIEHAIVGTS